MNQEDGSGNVRLERQVRRDRYHEVCTIRESMLMERVVKLEKALLSIARKDVNTLSAEGCQNVAQLALYDGDA
jgi:hypothetical protein